ncbi:MAG: class I SAM-dependent methyltransferase [Cyclobacteriaceae bacterium]|nr:class I SAM-dependent methyltransferase [Cyclobacteriaceae bacterium]
MLEYLKYFKFGKAFYQSSYFETVRLASLKEVLSEVKRYDVINYLLNKFDRRTSYLEIGLRNPEDNFYKVKSFFKCSVDPGYEVKLNLATYKMESDDFFQAIRDGEILSLDKRWDLIFIDGSHFASQVYKDINNALDFLKDDGFIVLHDVNPPSQWHARESFDFKFSPARYHWNGTVWKAFVKIREREDISACCIDTDWGVGVISKNIPLGSSLSLSSDFLFEFAELERKRKKYLELISFEEFQKRVSLYL